MADAIAYLLYRSQINQSLEVAHIRALPHRWPCTGSAAHVYLAQKINEQSCCHWRQTYTDKTDVACHLNTLNSGLTTSCVARHEHRRQFPDEVAGLKALCICSTILGLGQNANCVQQNWVNGWSTVVLGELTCPVLDSVTVLVWISELMAESGLN